MPLLSIEPIVNILKKTLKKIKENHSEIVGKFGYQTTLYLTEWAEMLRDEVLATALLDRLLNQCEVINLSGKSYRPENRKTICKD